VSPLITTRAGASAGAYGWGAAAFDPFSFQSIATTTVSGGTSFTFSSIASTYTHLQIRYNLIMGSGADAIFVQFNSDTGSNYARHGLWGSGAATGATGTASTTAMYAYGFQNGVIQTYPNVGIVDILDYASATKYKTLRTFAGADQNAAGGNVSVGSGLWMNTNAITSITFSSSSTFNSGTIALYGIKAAA
jgi:hypothetical protein